MFMIDDIENTDNVNVGLNFPRNLTESFFQTFILQILANVQSF